MLKAKMNIKHKLITMLTEIVPRIRYCFYRLRGECPTPDELENIKVKSLARSLRADTYKETLANVLEWQDKNMQFWIERHPLATLFWVICVLYLLGATCVIELNGLMMCLPWMFISSILLMLASITWILRSNRKVPWKKIPKWLKNTFCISMDFLIENKLGVCRDYAKLTACLLFNIYPNAEICYARISRHIATGIVIGDRLYMLDQHLPVLTKEKWNAYMGLKKPSYILRFDPIRKTLQKVNEQTYLRDKNESEPDTEKLAKTLTVLLNIKEQPEAKANKLEILWKKGAIRYEDDEIVNYSLAKFLKMKIFSHLVSINQVKRIRVLRREDDLTFIVYYVLN